MMVFGEGTIFFDEIRGIKSKMYWFEIVGAAAARFQSTTTDAWIFPGHNARHLAIA